MHLTQENVNNEVQFAKGIIKLLVSMVQQLTDICVEEDIDLSELHAFDLKSNEWPIAAL